MVPFNLKSVSKRQQMEKDSTIPPELQTQPQFHFPCKKLWEGHGAQIMTDYDSERSYL